MIFDAGVENPHGKTSRSPRLRGRDLAGNAKDQEARGGRDPGVAFDRETGADQRATGAAHGRHARHHWIAIADAGKFPFREHDVGFACKADR